MDETVFIRVKNPRTHIRQTWWNSCYTDYEITISSDNIAFAKQSSKVRRTYSDFVWLHKQLSKHGSITTKQPVLPKSKLFGKFNHEFLEKRRQDLQQYLVSVLQITPFLSDVALHLFLQTDLLVKEMDNVLSGQDSRNVVDIIDLEKKPVQRDCQAKNCSIASARDSGFSGSIHDETTEVNAEDPGWASLYVNHANCQNMGNGWSSGYTCASQISSNDSTSSKSSRCFRQPVQRTRAAAVLPGGQLVIPTNELPVQGVVEGFSTSNSLSQQNDESFRGKERQNYDADNETDSSQTDYDIIPENRRLRVRQWLNSALTENYEQCDSSDEEAEYSPNRIRLPEYDVISVTCSKGDLLSRCRSPQNAVHRSEEGSESSESFGKIEGCDEDDYSCFSVLHSSIDGIDFQDRDELSVSFKSVSSAALFRTYDVVEMIELKYLLYHVI